MKRNMIYGMILGMLGLCAGNALPAQSMRVDVPVCYVADHSFDPLIFPEGDSLALERFYAKLDRLLFEGEGRINILQMGGSHVQAGVFSNRMRGNFMNLYPDVTAGRGLFFPYKVAKTNNPSNYEVQYQGEWTAVRNVNRELSTVLGMSGIAVTTTDARAEIRVFLNRDNRYITDFNRLTVMGEEMYGCYEPYLLTACEQLPTFSSQAESEASSSVISKVASGKAAIWNEADTLKAVYDARMQTWTFQLDHYADAFLLGFKPADCPKMAKFQFTLTGFMAENDNRGISYHAIGVNGAAVGSYLKCEHFGRDMALLKPDLVIFGIGINDATLPDFSREMLGKRYDSLMLRIDSVAPDCDYVFLTNNDSYTRRGVNKNGLVAQKAFYEMAAEHHAAVWDIFGLMGGLKSAPEWEYAGLMKSDLIHFTNAGYVYLGDMLFNALMDDYARHLRRIRGQTK